MQQTSTQSGRPGQCLRGCLTSALYLCAGAGGGGGRQQCAGGVRADHPQRVRGVPAPPGLLPEGAAGGEPCCAPEAVWKQLTCHCPARDAVQVCLVPSSESSTRRALLSPANMCHVADMPPALCRYAQPKSAQQLVCYFGQLVLCWTLISHAYMKHCACAGCCPEDQPLCSGCFQKQCSASG